MRRWLVVLLMTWVAATSGCRIEWGSARDVGCDDGAPKGDVLIYTSMYRPVVDALEAELHTRLPTLRPHFYQAGSEKVAARLDAELAAGACPADILMTSDPAHYARLKSEGRLRPHISLGALRIPRPLIDVDGMFTTARISTMVLAYRKDLEHPPTRMTELWSERFRGEAIVGDPLSSGTFFTSLAVLEMVHGEGLFKALRASDVVATGGNSAVQEKLLGKEKQAGLLLLENVLAAAKAGQPLTYAVPEDGVVVVPGPIAIMSTSPHPSAAAAVMDFILSEPAQRIIVDVGLMHAAFENLPPPTGAPDLSTLLSHALKLEGATWEHLRVDGADMKARFGAAYGR